MRKSIRVYADTSVFGGVFDDEFKSASEAFFDEVRRGRFNLVISPIVVNEVDLAPELVRALFDEMLAYANLTPVSQEAIDLQDAYLKAKVVSERWSSDALHVAIATISGCEMIVSWNFHHIVHFEKIPLYNAVNVLNGFSEIEIYSPSQVIDYEE